MIIFFGTLIIISIHQTPTVYSYRRKSKLHLTEPDPYSEKKRPLFPLNQILRIQIGKFGIFIIDHKNVDPTLG
jgi:hypothetical protein